jgi:hypothetical protein
MLRMPAKLGSAAPGPVDVLARSYGFLGGEPIVARQIPRKLVDGRLTARPETHTYTAVATYGKLLEGVVVGVVPPGRTANEWQRLNVRVEGVAMPPPRADRASATP